MYVHTIHTYIPKQPGSKYLGIHLQAYFIPHRVGSIVGTTLIAKYARYSNMSNLYIPTCRYILES